VVFFKVVKKGAGVSYGHTWRAPEDTRVVTIPIGYGDGYSRRLSNVGSVLIRGRRYPIVGTICMDQLMVNIGQDEAFNGDEVVLIGAQRGDEITVSELAHLVGTDPRDVVVSLNQRIPRVFKGR
jgi:alanine racemase